jgi:outer membrane immunogenic protein
MCKPLLGSIAVAILIAGPAMAADLPVKAPVYKTPAPIKVFSWTGCYLGGNVGGLWLRKDFSAAPPDPPANLGSHDASSWLGGVQAGCDYQVGRWVFGIQGDYDWANARGEHPSLAAPQFTLGSRTKSLASLTGRIGYAWDRFLGYVKGGGAWERDDYDSYFLPTNALFAIASETRGGWTVGAGGEYAFTDQVSAFAEYNYYDFGTRTISFVAPNGLPVGNSYIRERKNVFKVGLNVRFGGWGPVAAKY